MHLEWIVCACELWARYARTPCHGIREEVQEIEMAGTTLFIDRAGFRVSS
jgi:hypothetical protein